MTKRKWIAYLTVAVLLLGIGITVWPYGNAKFWAADLKDVRKHADQGGISTVDLSDDRNVLGFVHYLFVGKVIDQGESRKINVFTLNQYQVHVITSIKGNLQGNVSIYSTSKQIGSTYIIGARWNTDNLNLLIPQDDVTSLITDNAALSDEQLKSLAESDPRIVALRKAYPNEVPYNADVKSHTTYNSYQSLMSGHLFTPLPLAESAPSAAPASAASVSPSESPSTAPELASPPEPSIEPTAAPEQPTPTPEPSPVPVPSDLAPTSSM